MYLLTSVGSSNYLPWDRGQGSNVGVNLEEGVRQLKPKQMRLHKSSQLIEEVGTKSMMVCR